MPDLPDARSRRLTRRGVLGLGLAAGAAVSGCTLTRSEPSSAPSSGASSSPTPTSGVSSVTPDIGTATTALAAVLAAQDAVRGTLRRYPALRSDLAGLEAMHEAHRRALVDAVPDGAQAGASTPSYAVPRRREIALTRVDGVETRLRTTLQALALKAESGDFARLLASMAAGISVHRVGA